MNEYARPEVLNDLAMLESHKVLRGGTDVAWDICQRLLARSREDAPSPWWELIRYRAAHLRLRSTLSQTELSEIDGWLAVAGESPVLGAWPHVYRIATLNRLGATPDALFAAHARAVRALHDHNALRTGSTWAPSRPSLQAGAFPLVDFAGMFLGIPRDGLEGLSHGVSFQGSKNNGWVVLRGWSRDAELRLTPPFALEEFESLRAQESNRLAVLGGENPCLYANAGEQPLAEPYARLLLALLQGNRDVPELQQLVYRGSEDRAAAFRQAKLRLTRALTPVGQPELVEQLLEARNDERGRAALGVVAAGPAIWLTSGTETG